MTRLPILVLLLIACGGAEHPRPVRPEPVVAEGVAPPAAPRRTILSIVGTNDVHGRAESVAILAGFVANLRRVRERDGGVLLIDGGDMFQGTLESNLGEGAAMIRAYNAIGYDAAAVGNHEFDFGPVGDATVPRAPEDDPRGALKLRASEASFPLLTANVEVTETGQRVDWPNMPASMTKDVAGTRVGILGVTTEATLLTTMSGNVRDLRIANLAERIVDVATRLRTDGARVVIVTAHAGGDCEETDDPLDLSSCDATEEIFQVATALPAGLVDVIVAGHTHAGVAHFVNGIPIIESFAYGHAFGRVDIVLEDGRPVSSTILPPQALCAEPTDDALACAPGEYEGAPVVVDRAVLEVLRPDLERANAVRAESLGITLATPMTRSHDAESPLGNWLADLMRVARPRADVALINGGGIRTDLPEGELRYGTLFQAFPFDNRFAFIRMTGAQLMKVFAHNLEGAHGILSISGVHATARCHGGEIEVSLTRPNGRPIRPTDRILVAASDFMATGGDGGFAAAGIEEGQVTIEDDGPPIREELARILRARRGTVRADDPAVFSADHPRFVFAARPLDCTSP